MIEDFADLSKNQKNDFTELEAVKELSGDGASDLRRALNIEAQKDGSLRIPLDKISGVYVGAYERATSQIQKMKNYNDIVKSRGGFVRGPD